MTFASYPVLSRPPHQECKDQVRTLKVESVIFRVNATLLSKASAAFRKIFQRYADSGQPIVLHGLKARKFKNLLWALSTSLLPQPSDETSLDCLLDIEELALYYSINHLQIRAESTIIALVAQGKNPAILSCTSLSLARMVKIALRVRSQYVLSFLLQMWTWRLHSRELHHVHAMRLAQPSLWTHDPQPFLKLLGHAFYAAMMNVEYKLNTDHSVAANPALTPSEIMHIRCGFHSLRSWWDHIASRPPSYEHSPQCICSEQCSTAWRDRFDEIVSSGCLPFPKADGIRRVQELQKCLTDDLFLIQQMPELCRQNALLELQKRREHLLDTLHHHFDL